jgi:transcription initiation factor TFIIB
MLENPFPTTSVDLIWDGKSASTDVANVDVFSFFDQFDQENVPIKEHGMTNSRSDELDKYYQCPNLACGSKKEPQLINYEYYCTDCNTMLDQKYIDLQAEWRFYGADDSKTRDPTRCGMPINELFPNLSLSTVIGYEGKNTKDSHNIRRYQKWNSVPYKEMSLFNTIDSIAIQASNGDLSTDIIEQAKILYKQISDKKITRGINRKGLIASSVYMSCKLNKVPRSANEIAKMFNIKVTTITKGCKIFHDTMKINVDCTQPQDFLMRFCCKLNMDEHYIDLCTYLIKMADNYSIVSESAPQSIVAGVIFLVSNLCSLGFSKREIHDACDTSEVTINKCFNKLYKYRVILFKDNAELLKKYQIILKKM